MEYEVTCVGNFTKDTIVSNGEERVVDGGGVNYGSHAARALGRRTAAVMNLAREDGRVVDELKRFGVEVFPTCGDRSTTLRLEYASEDPEERTITVASIADAITSREIEGIRSRAFVVSTSFRGEIDLETIGALAERSEMLSIDVQGYVRTIVDGTIRHCAWDNQDEYFHRASIVKADEIEAEFLTGKSGHHAACEVMYDRGAREILLTHREGIVVFDGHRFFDAPFVARSLEGRNGRGDTCVASYVAARLDKGPEEAVLWAAALTSRKLELPGPFRGTFDEVAETLERAYRVHSPH